MKTISPISQKNSSKNSSSYFGGGKKNVVQVYFHWIRGFFPPDFFRPSVMLEIVARVCHKTSCP